MALPESDITDHLRPYWVCFADIDGDPVRATTLPVDIIFSGTGDADLDGETYIAIDHSLVSIGEVIHQRGGSDTLALTLRGLPTIDDDLLTALDTKSNWQGRNVRLWCGILGGSTASNPEPYYTGKINKLVETLTPPSDDTPGSRTIGLEVESYLALLTMPRNRTYQDQAEHDATDISASRMRSAANGTRGSGLTPMATGGGSENRYEQPF